MLHGFRNKLGPQKMEQAGETDISNIKYKPVNAVRRWTYKLIYKLLWNILSFFNL